MKEEVIQIIQNTLIQKGSGIVALNISSQAAEAILTALTKAGYRVVREEQKPDGYISVHSVGGEVFAVEDIKVAQPTKKPSPLDELESYIRYEMKDMFANLTRLQTFQDVLTKIQSMRKVK